jgi:uncharacterized protein DUF2252
VNGKYRIVSQPPIVVPARDLMATYGMSPDQVNEAGRAQLLRRTCGWTLARAHARSGDPVAIAEHLGRSDAFDRSITDFSERYADQNERAYGEFVSAVRSGRLEAVEGV